MIGACKLNNKSMRNIRREAVYQCLAIDLAMLGVISKEECEMLIGCGIPKGLILPDGTAGKLISEKDLPEQPEFIQTEPTADGNNESGESEGAADGADDEPVVTGDEEPAADGNEGPEGEETINEE